MISLARIASVAGLGLLLIGSTSAYNLRDDEDYCTSGVPLDYSDLSALPELALSEPELFEASYNELNQIATESLSQISYSSFSSFLVDDKEKCVTCVKKTGVKVMCYAFKYLKKLCSKTKCPRLKKYCKILEEHKAFTYGLIWQKIRPLSLAGAYCCGHGECKGDFDPSSLFPGDDVVPQDLNDFITIAANESLPNILAQQDGEERTSFFGLTFSESKGKKCKDCLHHSIAFIMHHMFDIIEKYCHKSKDPRVQKVCHFIETHKQVAAGYIYGSVEPWKYAMGYCYGTKKCKDFHDDDDDKPLTLPHHIASSSIEFD